MRPRLILAATLIAPAITSTAVFPVLYKLLNPTEYDTPHGRLFAYEDHFGEFGGSFYSEGTTVMNIYLTSGNFDPVLRKEAEESFDLIYLREPNEKIVIHEAQYSMTELKKWRKLINQEPPGLPPGVNRRGVSHRDNRIVYWTADRANVPKIMGYVQSKGVPTDAVIVRIGPPMIKEGRAAQY